MNYKHKIKEISLKTDLFISYPEYLYPKKSEKIFKTNIVLILVLTFKVIYLIVMHSFWNDHSQISFIILVLAGNNDLFLHIYRLNTKQNRVFITIVGRIHDLSGNVLQICRTVLL